MKIIADEHIPCVREFFAQYGELILMPGRRIHAQDVQDADMLIVRSITHVNRELLQHSKVRFVGSVTAGADHLDTAWLNQAGITWCVANGFNAPPVADYVISTLAHLQKQNILPLTRLRAAVIGVGHVGRLVEARLRLLGVEVVVSDPLRAQQEPDFPHVPLAQLNELDLITVHVPLLRDVAHATYHFIDEHFLRQQKPGCVLINTSRGAVIDSAQLLHAGQHLHWCFDVWEHEPKIDKEILANSLLATPHIAGYSRQSKIRGIETIYRLACAHQFIVPFDFSPLNSPQQVLTFAGEAHSWRDIVLGIFNPAVVTSMMKTLLLAVADYGPLFDKMRNEFNYRHEFSATTVTAMLPSQEVEILRRLGVGIDTVR